MKFVAVTACPTGIAHSQMAAEQLRQTAEAAGHQVDVEVQGAMGTQNELTAEAIEQADAVVVAADTAIEGTERFVDKPVVDRPVGDAVRDADGVLRAAIAAAGMADASAVADASETASADTAEAAVPCGDSDDELGDDAGEKSQEATSLSERLTDRFRRLL